MKAGFSAILTLVAMAATPSLAEELPAGENEAAEKAGGTAPVPVADSDFEHLRTASPFTRVLDPSETYVLRGVAQFDEKQWATLYNRETKKTYVVDAEEANEVGLKLVEIVPPGRVPPGEELAAVSARIDFAGEEVELKYDQAQISPKAKGGGGPGGSRKSSDGQRRGPSEEDRRRYEKLSEENKAKLRAYAGHVFRNYPNLSREEKGNMIRGAVIRLGDGRDLEIPQGGDGGGVILRVQPGGGPGGGGSGGGPQRPGGR